MNVLGGELEVKIPFYIIPIYFDIRETHFEKSNVKLWAAYGACLVRASSGEGGNRLTTDSED